MGFKNMTEWDFVSSPYLQLELGEGSITIPTFIVKKAVLAAVL